MKKFLQNNWRELVLTTLLLAAFRYWPHFWQSYVDQQSAASDSGIVHILVFGGFGAAFILSLVWMLKWIYFPTFDAFIDSGRFRKAFNEIPPLYQLGVSAGFIVFLSWLVIRCAELAK